ncbi:hypothetical protein [Streptosporangium canum]|uniref:hypothetical protein n=1 Tax=Streptosporangium canum TaxID=324952 RepID=UPI000B8452B9|nr:hypothetical protein [Streptosporangium canum]
MEVIVNHPSGIHIVRQGYEDGFLYEYTVPTGISLNKSTSYYLLPPFKGRLLRSWSDKNHNFFAIWIPIGEINEVMRAAGVPPGSLHGFPVGEVELLHEGDRFKVERMRYKGSGWLYLVHLELGRPWPSFFFNPVMAPTREAPIIMADIEDGTLTTGFWVADSAPNVSTDDTKN